MSIVDQIKSDLLQQGDPEKASFLYGFFKSIPGGYGEGDRFIGVKVPDQKKVARKYFKLITLGELQPLLADPVHEHRLTALLIMVNKFEKAASEIEKKTIVDMYLNNYEFVNNWDLVDSSAYKILGPYLKDRSRDILYELANANHLWKQRIAIISTFYFIKNNDFEDSLRISKILLNHKHDLIHKAVGWMLREIGERNFEVEFDFLRSHYNQMPRTMLRYAIEKFSPELRHDFLKGVV